MKTNLLCIQTFRCRHACGEPDEPGGDGVAQNEMFWGDVSDIVSLGMDRKRAPWAVRSGELAAETFLSPLSLCGDKESGSFPVRKEQIQLMLYFKHGFSRGTAKNMELPSRPLRSTLRRSQGPRGGGNRR